MYDENRLAWVLFFLRISVFAVMLMWTVDKFVNPSHAMTVFAHFYSIENVSAQAMSVIAMAELAILVAFLFGVCRTYTYGAVLLFHAVSTLSSFEIYLTPFADYHLLFFAAWPMLAACLALFLLRESDSILTWN